MKPSMIVEKKLHQYILLKNCCFHSKSKAIDSKTLKYILCIKKDHKTSMKQTKYINVKKYKSFVQCLC